MMPICRTWQTRGAANGDYISGVNVEIVGSSAQFVCLISDSFVMLISAMADVI
jgi:hypothetical protein